MSEITRSKDMKCLRTVNRGMGHIGGSMGCTDLQYHQKYLSLSVAFPIVSSASVFYYL